MVGVAEGGHAMTYANISGSMDYQPNIESITLPRGSAPVHAMTRNDNHAFGSDEINNQLDELLHDLTREEGDIRGQLEWLESRGKKRKRRVDKWLNKVQHLKNEVRHMNNLEHLTEVVRKHKKQKPLVLSNELVGKSFERNLKKMWELLEDDQVFIIGIHGMGGVGKTCLAVHMENEIKRKGAFEHVFWVTVTHDFSILKLQQDIAERIGVKLYGDDERTRAANLSLALETKEKSVIILDDVWRNIDLQKVGIPLRVNGVKLVLTSRLECVCLQMDCPPKNIIRMYPLSDEEGWVLFLLKLGHNGTPATLPPKVLEIARSVASECEGLPLGISVMARTMKGVDNIRRWRLVLNRIRNLAMGKEMEEEVFKVLKLSYDNLMEKGTQNCFLRCALYHRDIDGFDLITELAEDRMKNGTRSMEQIFDEVCTMLDELKGHSLLMETNCIGMHGLLRKMVCHMLKKTHRCMAIDTFDGMKEYWTADLEVISLYYKNAAEIPQGTSPYCPRLSTLILHNINNIHIPECFLTRMNALTVLDLSRNGRLISLPNSLCNLGSLTSLVLKYCFSLEYVPPLGGLQALSRLEISATTVEEVLGLERLLNLKWLNLSRNPKLRLIPGLVLPSLAKLRYLDLRASDLIIVKVEDVQGMNMLEFFGGRFHDCENYNNYVQNIQDRGCGPKTHYLFSGTETAEFGEPSDRSSTYPTDDDCQIVTLLDDGECSHLLPTDLAELRVHENYHWICLCAALAPLPNVRSSLRKILIDRCTQLNSLFCLFGNLKNLESLRLHHLDSLTVICKEDVVDRTPALSPDGVFSHLRHFEIYGCDGYCRNLITWRQYL